MDRYAGRLGRARLTTVRSVRVRWRSLRAGRPLMIDPGMLALAELEEAGVAPLTHNVGGS
jgi:hypothetical protein